MEITSKTGQVIVIDRVLSPEHIESLWQYFQSLPLQQVNAGIHFAWTVTDGQPFMGNVVIADRGLKALENERLKACLQYPSNTPLDYVLSFILKHSGFFVPWIGREQVDWNYITATPYVYPPGTSLSWHTDSQAGKKLGAFTFYVHPKWEANWGGELMISGSIGEEATDTHTKIDLKDNTPTRFTRDAYNQFYQDGIFLTPRPNRLIIITSGILHKIARVEPAAGNHVRASVSGFFYKNF